MREEKIYKALSNTSVYFTKGGYDFLKDLYGNFDKYSEFLKVVLNKDEYDCWLFQTKFIKDTYFDCKE